MTVKKNPAGLVGLLFVLAMLVVALVVDRRGRGEAEAAAARIDAMMEPEEVPAGKIVPQKGTPTVEEVHQAVGKQPDGPAAKAGTMQVEAFSFGSLRKYHLYVYYKAGKPPRLIRFSLFKRAD